MVKKDFSLLDILQLLKIRWWIIALAAILFAGGGIAFSNLTYEPTYSSSVMVYVKDQPTQNSSAAEDVSQVNWALKVTKTYVEILKTNDFMEKISKKYETDCAELWAKKNYTATRLKTKCVQYDATDETYLFTFTVTTHDKDVSVSIAKIFKELAPQQIIDITGRDGIKIADGPSIPVNAANSKNTARNTIMGFLIGAVLSFLVVLIVDVTDVRIKDEDDLIENYQLPLIGSVPNFESAKKRGYGYGKK